MASQNERFRCVTEGNLIRRLANALALGCLLKPDLFPGDNKLSRTLAIVHIITHRLFPKSTAPDPK